MITVPDDLRTRLRHYGQEHVLAGWDQLTDHERRGLLEQLRALDFEQLQQLYAKRVHPFQAPPLDHIQPVPVARIDQDETARSRGEEVLRQGKVAVLLVAGGQGSRLGFEHPKGMYPIGPVSRKSVFQIHAEKVLALTRRYGRPIPFLVMTSPDNHRETRDFFEQLGLFGLPSEEVFFFAQGTMPALDLETGQLLLERYGKLFTSPNGHGGTLLALADSRLLDRMRQRGIEQIFYFQVDNPLVKVADPAFLGYHVASQAEVSTKVIPKNGPDDKLGNVVLLDGRCAMIEYSDLPAELARQTDERGRLRFWVGSPAIHFFDVRFLERMTRGDTRIPFHVARKKVSHMDKEGNQIEPARENALKFEMFIFDVLPRADRWTVVETSRHEEFEPLKNATGPDSPETVRRAISDLAADWLEKAGVEVPRTAEGHAAVPLEISPLLALDARELAQRVDHSLRIHGPTYLAP